MDRTANFTSAGTRRQQPYEPQLAVRTIADSIAIDFTASVNCAISTRAASNSKFRSTRGRPGARLNAVSGGLHAAPQRDDRRHVHPVLCAASDWVTSPETIFEKISHFNSGDNYSKAGDPH